MIVGNGDIASALKVIDDNDDITYFASGVSNSQETRQAEFDREASLLELQDKNTHLVYFSTLAVYYGATQYVQHKMSMEELVKSRFKKYTIIRLGNILWGNNPHTLINFIRRKIKNGEKYEARDEYRYIIDKDEFLHWMKLIPDWNCEMNITGNRMKVKDIIQKYGYIDIHPE